jgi:DNA mismatch endonuclease (patch repair protein)
VWSRGMSDTLSPSQRSQLMSRIRGLNTGPERALFQALGARRLKYKKHVKDLPGRPEAVFPESRVVVFVDGCFWHGCRWHYRPPRTNRSYWSKKLKANVARDRAQSKALRDTGWTVIRLWEHTVVADSAQAVWKIEKVVSARCASAKRREAK